MLLRMHWTGPDMFESMLAQLWLGDSAFPPLGPSRIFKLSCDIHHSRNFVLVLACAGTSSLQPVIVETEPCWLMVCSVTIIKVPIESMFLMVQPSRTQLLKMHVKDAYINEVHLPPSEFDLQLWTGETQNRNIIHRINSLFPNSILLFAHIPKIPFSPTFSLSVSENSVTTRPTRPSQHF